MQTKTMTMTGASNRVRILMLGMLMAVLATLALTTWAQPTPGGPPPGGEGGGWMHRHHHDGDMHGGGMGGFLMGRGVDRMLDGLNATDQQRAQIKQIAQAAATDLQGQRQAARDLRQRALQVFSAPNVDANAAESVRLQMMAQHDQASRRLTQAMLDVARVLTPEQRAKLVQRIADRQAMMRDRMERMHREHDMRQGGPGAPSAPRQ